MASPWVFIATSTTLLRAANANRLAAIKGRPGAKAGPSIAQLNTISEAVKARRLPTRGTMRPPSWRPRTAPASNPRRAIANWPSLKSRPPLMAGTREAKVANMIPVTEK